MAKLKLNSAIMDDLKAAASDSFIDNLKMLEVDRIIPNDNNFYEMTEIEELAEDIERQGLMSVLVVTEDNGEFHLVSGHRRLKAVKLLIDEGRRKSTTVPCYIWGTVFAVYCGYQENNKMEWWQSLIISIAPAIITGIITSKASKKSRLRENNEAINKLSEKIGNNNFERSLQSQIGVKDNDCSLAERIGNVKDSGSLTYQHLMILEAVNSYKKEKGDQMKKLSKRQKDIKKMIEYISEVFEDWEVLTHRDSELKEEIENLKKENRELKQEIICLKQEKTVVIEKDEIDKEIVL